MKKGNFSSDFTVPESQPHFIKEPSIDDFEEFHDLSSPPDAPFLPTPNFNNNETPYSEPIS